ncbi:hypothetical protein CFAM422_001284 [Trichoderma lentiforme]|uniref:Uncharacterized protein n=1 Tax=Trichoderma lentiforme TaxID=1567552 RepID=A0A9P4XPX2_9HYPO|nr:hypothetical protein CFAM422_001284 [Trichoderma lentiforme]
MTCPSAASSLLRTYQNQQREGSCIYRANNVKWIGQVDFDLSSRAERGRMLSCGRAVHNSTEEDLDLGKLTPPVWIGSVPNGQEVPSEILSVKTAERKSTAPGGAEQTKSGEACGTAFSVDDDY